MLIISFSTMTMFALKVWKFADQQLRIATLSLINVIPSELCNMLSLVSRTIGLQISAYPEDLNFVFCKGVFKTEVIVELSNIC